MANIISVSALNTYVRSLLEQDNHLSDIAVKGEISNFICNTKSGHCYFSLIDQNASVKAVAFKREAEQFSFRPENGMRVLARCRVTLYEKGGSYQIIVRDLFPDGEGAMALAFAQMKDRLEKEGLFAPEHKKTLPAIPSGIGLVTSKTGAALQDILHVAARRYPMARLLLAPVQVQGFEAVPDIALAIKRLDETDGVDVIIVARGGGSSEDLWVFNDEAIARAVHAARTPVISAIGHEVDYTILDYVADVRAPTPSAAAELALPDIRALYSQIEEIYKSIAYSMWQKLDSCYNKYSYALERWKTGGPGDVLAARQHQLTQIAQGLERSMAGKLERAEEQLRQNARMAAGLNPLAVLARGYAYVRKQGHILKSRAQIHGGDLLEICMFGGNVRCRAEDTSEEKG